MRAFFDPFWLVRAMGAACISVQAANSQTRLGKLLALFSF